MPCRTVLLLLAVLATAHAARAELRNATAEHHGYITIDPAKDANIFYWVFDSQNDPATDPLVLWMTGGPGCSSELALLFENGPFWVDANGQTHANPFSWNKFANLLYVDQPVGTGFSYASSDYIFTEEAVASEMHTFLQKFFALYPQYWRTGQEFYIIGESYGGHYVPAVAAYIVEENANNKSAFQIPLKGIGIGNGWTDPKTQYGAYGTFAYENSLIDKSTYTMMNRTYTKCAALIDAERWDDAEEVCNTLMGTVLQEAGNINVYNIKLPCNPPPLCYDFSNVTRYLNTPSVQQALGVASQHITWSACDDTVNSLFGVDRIESFRADIPKVLASGTRVLVYSGMLDLICNYVGGAEWTAKMQWPGQSSFNSQSLKDWTVDGAVAGHVKTFDNMTWLEVLNAGHMVPHDQPSVALSMLSSFLKNQPFA